jgi:hypothetical protein
MEYIEGDTLGAKLRNEGPLDPATVLEVLRPVCAALHRAHADGIVHRDLKPANIMILKDGRTKVLDFGIAALTRANEPKLTQAGLVVGTANYLAPEQVEVQSVDARTDIYSLGVILFECLTGRIPFVENGDPARVMIAHMTKAPPKLRDVAPGRAFPDAVEAVVAKALAKRPDDRFQDALSLARALEAAVAGGGGEARIRGAATEAFTPPSAPAVMRGRTRLEIPEGASTEGLRTVYAIAGPSLRFGRSKPGQEGSDNNLVLRVLPCGTADEANVKLTKTMSGAHGEIIERDGAAWLVDRSRTGTFIDGTRAAANTPVKLPGRFRLTLGVALSLEGRVLPEDAGAARPLECVILRRVENCPHHAYVWVVRRATFGPEPGAALLLKPFLRAQVEARGGDIVLNLPPSLIAHASAIGDETRFDLD